MTSRRAEPLPGDAHARFSRLVREHQRDLVAHVRVVYPYVDVDTVVNEVFVTAWQRLDDVPSDRTGTWLRATARYVVSNRRRGERRWRALNDRVARLEGVAHAPAPDHDAGIELQVVLDAMATLSSSDREVLLMTALDDLSSVDVGEILGVTAHTAAVRISRARARLRAAVAVRSEPSGLPEQGGTS
jgi:RNA polymerase sigma-70 factor (ECF subfamily)